MNQSKKADPRSWKKWYKAGAVNMPSLDEKNLFVDSTCVHFYGVAAGNTVLCIGSVIIADSVSKPALSVVVPTRGKYKARTRLSKIPGDAIPVDLFFRNHI